MKRLSSFIMGMLVGAGLLHLATNYHVVRGDDGFHLVAKTLPHLAEAYVDVRQFGVTDWAEHQELTLAITQAGKQHLLANSATSLIQDGINHGLQGNVFQGNAPPPQSP